MGLADLLECFDEAPSENGPGKEWLAGHAAGLDEGRTRARAEAALLQEETARTIADLALTFEEARVHILARLAPLFTTLAETAVPLILRDTFGASLLDELMRAAREDTEAPLELLVAPADAAAFEAVLPLAPGTQVILHTDPRLASGQVIIEGGASGATSLDLVRLGHGISEALAALAEPVKGHEHHG